MTAVVVYRSVQLGLTRNSAVLKLEVRSYRMTNSVLARLAR